MAKKTDAELGKIVRDAVKDIQLGANEEIVSVKIIITPEIKNTVANVTFVKGGKGINIEKYNTDDETSKNAW